jgi:microcystin-dependent protein
LVPVTRAEFLKAFGMAAAAPAVNLDWLSAGDHGSVSYDDVFVGQILIIPFTFAPKGFAFCNGQLMPISQNTALFSLLGTYYGGDGKSTFALPNLQGRVPLHNGQGAGLTMRTQGETGGAETHTLTSAEMTAHTHVLKSGLTAQALCRNVQGALGTPAGNMPAIGAAAQPGAFSSAAPDANMHSGAIVATGAPTAAAAGSGQPHNNLAPYLVLNFVIALQGIYPPRE